MSTPTFVLIGHCMPDSGLLTSAITRAVPGALVHRANHPRELEAHRRAGVVWLVNRVLDGAFDDDDGIKLIHLESGRADGPVLMLISNDASAQAAANERGAFEGFGKRATHAPTTVELLRRAVNRA